MGRTKIDQRDSPIDSTWTACERCSTQDQCISEEEIVCLFCKLTKIKVKEIC